MRILLSGGSSGIGYAVSQILIKQGHEVFSIDINHPSKPIAGVKTFIADVSNSEQIRKTLSQISFPIDILYNNAGVMRRGLLLDSSEADFDLLFRINVKGSWLLLKEARSYLSKNPLIVQMSSRHAINPPDNPALYAWTKQTVKSFAEDLAKHYPNYRVKLLFPGPVDTPLSYVDVPENELAEKKKLNHPPEYVAEKIVQLMFSNHNQLMFNPESWDYELL